VQAVREEVQVTPVTDIHPEVLTLCEKFGQDVNRVKSVFITPTHIMFVRYLEDENGKVYRDPDTGEVAVDFQEYEVRT
jgi:hypothetical protein